MSHPDWIESPRINIARTTSWRIEEGLKEDGKYYITYRDGSEFRVAEAEIDEEHYITPDQSFKRDVVFYRPPAPGTTIADVRYATHVIDDGTYFHFAHSTPDQHADFAARIKAFCLSVFSTRIAKRSLKVVEATNAVAQSQAVLAARALINFTDAVANLAHTTAMAKELGYYHREQGDHKRDALIAAIDAVLADWFEKGKTDKALRLARQSVHAAALEVKVAYSAKSTTTTRTERLAAAAAEAKRKAEMAAESESESGAGQN